MKINDLKNTFEGKKVLITGHTGFKGSWLSILLESIGAEIIGISIDSNSNEGIYQTCLMESKLKDDIRLDICDKQKFAKVIKKTKPDFIFHLAAQALVSQSYVNPAKTIMTNAIGTLNLLEALKDIENKIVVVLITSDKCYENIETFYGYKETDQLGGKDPYSASKAYAEIISNSYIRSILNRKENINIATARAGNVIGGGDWSKDRLIPDAVSHWQNNKILEIRSPNSTRPWQHVLEPLSGYLQLAEYLTRNSIHNDELSGRSFNFGPRPGDTISVEKVIRIFSTFWENSKFQIKEDKSFKEAGLLNLSIDKSCRILNWEPRLRINEALSLTADWYKNLSKKNDMYKFTLDQIFTYFEK